MLRCRKTAVGSFFSLFFVGLFIHPASSISCFQCNSHINQGCAELRVNDTNSLYYQPCEENNLNRSVFCRKTYLTIKMEFMAGGLQERVIRTCGWQKHDGKKECYRRDDPDHEEIVCQCFTDGCNAASSLLAVPAIAIFSLVLLSTS